MSRFLTAAALASFATVLAVPAAHAATAAVEYGDLDLGSSAGQAKLDSRITKAARKICSEAVTGSHIAAVDAACMSKVRSQVERQVASRRATLQRGG